MQSIDSIEKECAAARKACVLFEHPNRGVIEISGSDRMSFLHNVLTNDIKSLSPGKGVPACLLNAQAKIVAQVNVLCFDRFLWLAFDYPLRKKLSEALDRLIIMEDVALKDKSENLKLISIHGPKTKELLKKILFKKDPPNETLGHETVTMDGMTSVLIRINLTGEIGYGFLTPKIEVGNFKLAIERIGVSFDLVEIHPETLETLRIEAGIPRYGTDYDNSNIPLEVRLDHTISFTKGCFPGQEIIARLDSRGGVARKLCGLILKLKGETAPRKNSIILKDNSEVGLITSAAFSPTLKKIIALGFLKKEFWTAGTDLVVEDNGNKIPACVTTLPFYATITK